MSEDDVVILPQEEETEEMKKLSDAEIASLQSLCQKIEYVDIDSVRLSPNKARRIRNAIPKVAASIRTLGFRSPIYVDGNADNEIIAGHTRYCAARLLGLKKIPIVKVTDLKPSLVKFLRLADNRVGEFTSWNFEELNKTLLELRSRMPKTDFESMGFVKPLDINLDDEDELDENSYDEPNERNLRCPKCGYEASASFFRKENSDEVAEEEKEENHKEDSEKKQEEQKIKHEPESIENVLKEVANDVQGLSEEEVSKIQELVQTIEYVGIDEIKPSENKERNIEGGIEKVAAVIRKVGFRNPIYVGSYGEIICGHTRWYAAKSIGLTSVPVVRVTDLSNDQLTLLRLADNRVAEFSNWEFYEMNKEIEEIKVELPEELEETGLFSKELLKWDSEEHKSETSGKQVEKVMICTKCGHKDDVVSFRKE